MFSLLPTSKKNSQKTKILKDFVGSVTHIQIYWAQTSAKSLINDVLATQTG